MILDFQELLRFHFGARQWASELNENPKQIQNPANHNSDQNLISIASSRLLLCEVVVLGVGKPIFRFAMVRLPMGGGRKCTKTPSRSAYLRELGLIFNKNQKVLKKFT